jgi:hypothetical protein
MSRGGERPAEEEEGGGAEKDEDGDAWCPHVAEGWGRDVRRADEVWAWSRDAVRVYGVDRVSRLARTRIMYKDAKDKRYKAKSLSGVEVC